MQVCEGNGSNKFIDGLEDCNHLTAGAMRFFHDGRKSGHRILNFAERKLFSRCIHIFAPHASGKTNRFPWTCRRWVLSLNLEWFVLVRVKAQTKQEPWLNKK